MKSGFGATKVASPPLETALSSITGKGSVRTDPSMSLDTSEVLGAIGKGNTARESGVFLETNGGNARIQKGTVSDDENGTSERATLELESPQMEKQSVVQRNRGDACQQG